jgi:large subunit ribosomal protein L23
MPDLYQIIERPIITEKALTAGGDRQYAFVVHPQANKFEIKNAVQKLFTTPEGEPIKVAAVNTITIKGKTKRFRAFGRANVGKTSGYKKAIVTLVEGQSITIFEGV